MTETRASYNTSEVYADWLPPQAEDQWSLMVATDLEADPIYLVCRELEKGDIGATEATRRIHKIARRMELAGLAGWVDPEDLF